MVAAVMMEELEEQEDQPTVAVVQEVMEILAQALERQELPIQVVVLEEQDMVKTYQDQLVVQE